MLKEHYWFSKQENLLEKQQHYTMFQCLHWPDTIKILMLLTRKLEPVLSSIVEQRIAEWILYRAERDFPVGKTDILDAV